MPAEFKTPEGALLPEAEKPLHPYQQEMLGAIQDARNNWVECAYIDSATGTGKDFVIARAVKHFIDTNPSERILYMAHNRFILNQAAQEIAEVTPGISQGRMFGGEFQDQRQITFATFQTQSRPLGAGRVYEAYDPEEYDVVIVNESHHGPAPTYRPVIEHYRPELLLGATATAERRDQQDIGEIFGDPIFTLKLEEAIAKGYLTKPDYHVLTDHVRHLDSFSGRLEDGISARDLQEINGNVLVPQRDEEIVDTVVEYLKQTDNPRPLFFCSSIAHAEHYNQLLNERMPGMATTMHSEVPDKEQDQRLKAFRKGKTPGLFVVDMFNEGVDVPEINVVVFLRQTESSTVFFQQLGRGLRKVPGKDKVLVLDFVANWDRLSTLQNLQSSIRGYRERQPRELRTTNTDISFNFSPEALEAVEVIEEARERERRTPVRPPKRDRVAEASSELQALLDIQPEELPSFQLSKEDWEDFEKRIGAGDKQAIKELVSRCLLKAYASAKKLTENIEFEELNVEDLFHYAVQEVNEAAKNYDPQQKTSLSHNVTQALSRKLKERAREQALVWLPPSFYDDLHQIKAARAKIAKELGSVAADEATPSMISEYSGVDLESVMQYHHLQYENMGQVEEAAQVIDEEADSFEIIEEFFRNWDLRDALENLSYRERRVLELRYGLWGGGPSRTIYEVGREFNVSRERIRQIENQSLKKLGSLPLLRKKIIPDEEDPTYPGRLQNKALEERLSSQSHRQARTIARHLGWRRHGSWSRFRSIEPLSEAREAIYHEAIATLAIHELYRQRGLHKKISRGGLFSYFQRNQFNPQVDYEDFLEGLDRLVQDGVAVGSWSKDSNDNVVEHIKLVNSKGAVRSRLHKTLNESGLM